jgi:hypothetical protein
LVRDAFLGKLCGDFAYLPLLGEHCLCIGGGLGEEVLKLKAFLHKLISEVSRVIEKGLPQAGKACELVFREIT